jgi:hypothetical protein
MAYYFIIFCFFVAPSLSRCRQDEEKKSDFKNQSLLAGHRMKNKPWFFKTMKKPMVLTCILKECKLLHFHGFEKTMGFQGHRMKIP